MPGCRFGSKQRTTPKPRVVNVWSNAQPVRQTSHMITNFTASDIPDQTGKTFFITGANTGLGFESAEAFAGKNGRVLVAVRNPGKGETAIDQTRQEHPGADVQFVRIDLAGLASIRKAAGIVAHEPRLDVLLNNAGVMMNPKTLTKDGFESQFGINHLGHLALTAHLLPSLLETPRSRIVNVSSNSHRMGDGDLYWDDIDAGQRYSPQGRYSASKLANLLFTYELDRRLKAKEAGTLAVAAHPGMADTELGRHYPGWGQSTSRPRQAHHGALAQLRRERGVAPGAGSDPPGGRGGSVLRSEQARGSGRQGQAGRLERREQGPREGPPALGSQHRDDRCRSGAAIVVTRELRSSL